jgi:hypothetical protein
MADTWKQVRIDEEFAKRVDEILDGDTDKVPMKVQVGLILAMQSQILRATNSVVEGLVGVQDRQDIANGRTGKLEIEIVELKKKNIINWIIINPKSAVMWFIVSFVVLETLAHELTSGDNIAFILGVVRKWAGL